MKYAFFLGCTIPARARNYEMSARRVMEQLSIETVNVEEFICCGFPIKSSDNISSETMAAYNLCIAQEKNLDILTLCSSCASALTEVAHQLEEDGPARKEMNQELSRVGMEYHGGVKVRHLARVLYEDIDSEGLKKYFKRDLSGLKIASHYGCHYIKPSEIYEGFDDVEDPKSIDALVALTGAKTVDYRNKKRCCGGPLLPVNEDVASSISKEKLDDISEAAADAICLVCPFCAVMYDSNQKSIESQFDVSYNLPVLYLTQVLGLAMGFDRKELGLNMNVVKTKELLKDYFE